MLSGNLLSTGMSNRDTIASALLDLLRFLAAVTVVVYHTASFATIKPPLSATEESPFWIILHLIYMWTTSGYQAVMVFFVLSGYLVGSNVLKTMRSGTWSWKTYLIHRFTRLYVVLIPALLLTALLAAIQMHIFGPVWYFRNDLNFKVFLGNVAFLQDIRISEFGGNGPLWSLSFEFWYYLMFPLLALVIYGQKRITKISSAFLLSMLGILLGWNVARYFLVWLLGAGVAWVPQLRIHRNIYRRLLVPGVFILAIETLFVPYQILHIAAPTYMSPNLQYFPDACVGMAFALLIYVVVAAYENKRSVRFKRLSSYWAGFSYTLYLTHYPVLHLLFAWKDSSHPFMFQRFEHVAPIALASTLLWAWLVSRVFECRTGIVRGYLLQRVNGWTSAKKPINPGGRPRSRDESN